MILVHPTEIAREDVGEFHWSTSFVLTMSWDHNS